MCYKENCEIFPNVFFKEIRKLYHKYEISSNRLPVIAIQYLNLACLCKLLAIR